ncbi:hypothetical protein ACED51_19880 [Photobacterium swingsii]|uniref:hypothetical protein n=1 Tax=Photobacterium swingsii TaxID=680026 RepID=UPI00352DA29A
MNMKILVAALSLAVSIPSFAAREVRQSIIVADVAGSIYVHKPALDVKFKKYMNKTMKADMDWEIYWTLKNGLQIDYTCTNKDPKKDMCTNIKIEIEEGSATHELSTSNQRVKLNKRSRFQNDHLKTTAYFDSSGFDGEVKATGRLVLSQAI